MWCYISFGVLGGVLYVGKQVFLHHCVFSRSLAGVLTFDEAVIKHPRAFTFADMQGAPHLFTRQDLR